jgi:hypothetical protein
MQFPCFKPERSGLGFQFRHSPNDHSKEMLGFARFLPARSNAFQKFLFGNCVVSFDVVSANASAGSDKLTDNSVGDRILWNRFREINNCFAKSGCSFFQIVNPLCLWFFANNSCAIIPKRIVGPRILALRSRHSFILRHSSFVISFSPRCAIPCTAIAWQIPNHASPLRVKS